MPIEHADLLLEASEQPIEASELAVEAPEHPVEASELGVEVPEQLIEAADQPSVHANCASEAADSVPDASEFISHGAGGVLRIAAPLFFGVPQPAAHTADYLLHRKCSNFVASYVTQKRGTVPPFWVS